MTLDKSSRPILQKLVSNAPQGAMLDLESRAVPSVHKAGSAANVQQVCSLMSDVMQCHTMSSASNFLIQEKATAITVTNQIC